MKISDVIRNISDMVDSTPTERSSGDNTSKFTAFTGDLTLVELPDGEDEKRREPGKMPSGNDEMPEDLYLPPLQLKSELLKKAVDVENVFDDGTPAVRYNEEYGDEGWHGDDNDHSYIGAPQTAEEVDGQPDPNETTDGSDSGKRSKPRADSDDSDDDDSDDDEERERADESLNRILELALVKESNYHDSKFVDRTERLERLMALDKRTGESIDRILELALVKESNYHDSIVEWSEDDNEDPDVAKADRELSRLGKTSIKAANIDTDKDKLDDKEEEQLDEEVKEMNRMRELAGLNPAVLFALGDDDYPV
jgi:hypothetical protein